MDTGADATVNLAAIGGDIANDDNDAESSVKEANSGKQRRRVSFRDPEVVCVGFGAERSRTSDDDGDDAKTTFQFGGDEFDVWDDVARSENGSLLDDDHSSVEQGDEDRVVPEENAPAVEGTTAIIADQGPDGESPIDDDRALGTRLLIPATDDDEWAAVNEFREQIAKQEEDRLVNSPAGIRPKGRWTPIGYNEARDVLQTLILDDDTVLNRIERFDFRQRNCLFRFVHQVFGPPDFRQVHLRQERDSVFAMAATPLDTDALEVHERLIQSIYRGLTGQTEPCPRMGRHWEVIGFQGADPATDLRGSGVFGLLQLLYFMKQSPPLLQRIFTLSRDDRQVTWADSRFLRYTLSGTPAECGRVSFFPPGNVFPTCVAQSLPFAVVSLNLTGVCLNVLRETKIYSLCVRRNSVMDTMGVLYISLYYDLYLSWKNEGKTIMDFPGTRNDIERRARADPGKLIARYERNNVSPLESITSPQEFIPNT